jgi:hypothetical protein
MSERYNPKKVRQARAAAIAKGAPRDVVLARAEAKPAGIMADVPLPLAMSGILCRAHGRPWRTCATCSVARKKGI